ncbi:MAG: sugar transferase [Betaproteobacteria bacterium]
MKRLFDLVMSILLMGLLAFPMAVIAILIKVSSPGPVLHWSRRVGRLNKFFSMPKFRTMKIETPTVATDLLDNPDQWMTPIGPFLRKLSLDELPQLWSIFMGQMSFVGPRPALFNQYDLITLRTSRGIHELVPGLTGWAQVKKRDTVTTAQKVTLDQEYLSRRSFWFDLKIIWLTTFKVISSEGVSH